MSYIGISPGDRALLSGCNQSCIVCVNQISNSVNGDLKLVSLVISPTLHLAADDLPVRQSNDSTVEIVLRVNQSVLSRAETQSDGNCQNDDQ